MKMLTSEIRKEIVRCDAHVGFVEGEISLFIQLFVRGKGSGAYYTVELAFLLLS